MDPAPEHGTAMDRALIDMVDLGLLAKHAHWNVVGPMFGSLHLLLDELAEIARTGADDIAERAMTLGHNPDGRVESIAAAACLPRLSPGAIADADAVETFGSLLDLVTTRLHESIDLVEGDPVSQDLLTGIAARVEKHAWLIRAHGPGAH